MGGVCDHGQYLHLEASGDGRAQAGDGSGSSKSAPPIVQILTVIADASSEGLLRCKNRNCAGAHIHAGVLFI